jgi:hypothetical protein
MEDLLRYQAGLATAHSADKQAHFTYNYAMRFEERTPPKANNSNYENLEQHFLRFAFICMRAIIDRG